MIRKLPILLFLLAVILFDAFQQKYYLDTFNLHPEGTTVSVAQLFYSHFIRWAVYALFHVPFFVLLHRKLTKSPGFGHRFSLKVFSSLFALLIISIVCIAILNRIQYGGVLSMGGIADNVLFFFYQKGLTFLIVSAALYLLTYSLAQGHEMHAKNATIHELTLETARLSDALDKDKEAEMEMKIGGKAYRVPVSEIIWIQSDDYCVKVHTETRSYTIRMSLRKLASQLSSHGFVRVHRTALCNTHYVEHIDYQNALIALTNKRSIPFTKAGIKALKHRLRSVVDH